MQNASLALRHTDEQTSLVNDLRTDLLLGRLHLEYQPIVSLLSDQIVGTEALIRWYHARLGPITPSRFIPLAEQSGLIGPLGWWVTRQASQQLATWQLLARGLERLTMSVNLSALQLAHRGMIKDVAKVLEETGLDPQTLQLEITETAVMPQCSTILTNIQELKALGVRLAIDDFGMGYSSLSYLLRLPVDTIKLDRSFISRLGADRRSEALVRAILHFAQETGQTVIAEGVETEQQRDWLRSEHCPCAQGYYFSKPLSRACAGALLLARS